MDNRIVIEMSQRFIRLSHKITYEKSIKNLEWVNKVFAPEILLTPVWICMQYEKKMSISRMGGVNIGVWM